MSNRRKRRGPDVWSGTEKELRETLLEGTAGPGEALDFRCLHCGAHICVATERLKGLLVVQMHMERKHDMNSQLTILAEGEGGDYICGPAPNRCDLCLTVVEKPWWVYTTGPGMRAADPEWMVCDSCDKIIRAPDSLPELLMRSVSVQAESQKLSREEALQFAPRLAEIIRDFLNNLTGEPVREYP